MVSRALASQLGYLGSSSVLMSFGSVLCHLWASVSLILREKVGLNGF